MASIRTKIAQAILGKLANVTALKYRAFDVVRLQASDFQDWELPAVQIYDLVEIGIHERSLARKSWTLAVEVIVGPNGTTTPSQETLWDLMQDIEAALWSQPNLGVPEVIHAVIGSSSTDLHLMSPFYLGRIEMTVEYKQPLTGTC
jgi:hypothetical protein